MLWNLAFRVILLAVLVYGSSHASGQQRQVCLSIDDLPVVNYGVSDPAFLTSVFHQITDTLGFYRVPAIGFVNAKKLYAGDSLAEYRVGFLERWVDLGFDLGNHTFSHPDYNKTTLAEFTADIVKGETIPKKVTTERGKDFRYFRHPFLHVGNTRLKADSLSEYLTERGYLSAPVTIDNEDYLFALAYHRSWQKGDTGLMRRIGTDYIVYMEQMLKYVEKESNLLFGRDIGQILLTHASLLNADWFGALIRMYHRNGYSFEPMDKVLEDPAYLTEITVFGNWGISWLDRWALSQGKKGDFFAGEPVTPEYIRVMTK